MSCKQLRFKMQNKILRNGIGVKLVIKIDNQVGDSDSGDHCFFHKG